LPLLEKAYAKIHGDYQAIDGGLSGDAVEDLTGGVTTTIYTNRIMDKNMLWKELLNKEEFIFGASPPTWLRGPASSSRQGVPLYHAYSIMKAVEENGPKQEDDATGPKGKEITVKLVKLRYAFLWRISFRVNLTSKLETHGENATIAALESGLVHGATDPENGQLTG
jgi:hypothetical protein